jgi:hypothetical protein
MELQVDIAQDALAMIDYSGRPRLLLISEKEPDKQFENAAEAAGLQVVARVSLQDAEEKLTQQIGLEAVWLELDGADASSTDGLFERLQTAAENARYRSIICFPRELIDAVAARASHPEVCLLCNPTDRDVAGALESVVLQKPLALHDVSRQRRPAGLRQISQEVGRIAEMLAELSTAENGSGAPVTRSGSVLRLEASHVRAIYRARRVRDQYFESELFADPAWDMMLDLMIARLERRPVSVSSLCIAAAVPPTTALRWIKTLTDAGVFVRTPDPSDGRRIYMTLSDESAERVEACLLDAQRNAGLLM